MGWPRFPWKCTHPLIQRAASQRRQCQQEGALHVLGAILCHPHRRPGHLQLQSLGPHTAPSAYVIKTNQSQLQNNDVATDGAEAEKNEVDATEAMDTLEAPGSPRQDTTLNSEDLANAARFAGMAVLTHSGLSKHLLSRLIHSCVSKPQRLARRDLLRSTFDRVSRLGNTHV